MHPYIQCLCPATGRIYRTSRCSLPKFKGTHFHAPSVNRLQTQAWQKTRQLTSQYVSPKASGLWLISLNRFQWALGDRDQGKANRQANLRPEPLSRPLRTTSWSNHFQPPSCPLGLYRSAISILTICRRILGLVRVPCRIRHASVTVLPRCHHLRPNPRKLMSRPIKLDTRLERPQHLSVLTQVPVRQELSVKALTSLEVVLVTGSLDEKPVQVSMARNSCSPPADRATVNPVQRLISLQLQQNKSPGQAADTQPLSKEVRVAMSIAFLALTYP